MSDSKIEILHPEAVVATKTTIKQHERRLVQNPLTIEMANELKHHRDLFIRYFLKLCLIIDNRAFFVRHRRIIESSLANTNFNQCDIIEM